MGDIYGPILMLIGAKVALAIFHLDMIYPHHLGVENPCFTWRWCLVLRICNMDRATSKICIFLVIRPAQSPLNLMLCLFTQTRVAVALSVQIQHLANVTSVECSKMTWNVAKHQQFSFYFRNISLYVKTTMHSRWKTVYKRVQFSISFILCRTVCHPRRFFHCIHYFLVFDAVQLTKLYTCTISSSMDIQTFTHDGVRLFPSLTNYLRLMMTKQHAKPCQSNTGNPAARKEAVESTNGSHL